MTELEAAYVRVYNHARQMCIDELANKSKDIIRDNSPAANVVAWAQRVIKNMPTPVPTQKEDPQ